MSFLSGIFSGITGAIGTILGVGTKVVGGISSVLDASGIATLATLISTLTGNISTIITAFTGQIEGLIKPITDVVDSVKTFADTIENKIITPIIRPIVDTVTKIEGLTRTIDRLVDQGISGILEIPKAVSSSLTSIEANWSRSTALLAEANKKIVTEDLLPGIHESIAPGLQALTAAYLKFSAPNVLDPDQAERVPLSFSAGEAINTTILKAIQDTYKNPDTWWKFIFFIITDAAALLSGTASSLISSIDAGSKQAKFASASEILGVGDAIALHQRGILSDSDLMNELRRNGLNETRANALLQGAIYLPSPGEALDWWLKGIIDEGNLHDILRHHGWNAATIVAAKDATKVQIGESTLLDWLARDIIDQRDFDDRMRSKGYSPQDIGRVLKDALVNPQVNTAINNHWNYVAAQAKWFPETYGSAPPPEVANAGRAARIDPVEVERRWQSQFSAMPVSTAIELFFRGEVNRRQVETVVEQNGFPKGMAELLIKAQSPLLTVRSVPSLVARGELSVADGMKRLELLGYTIEDAALLLDAAKDALAKDAKAATTDETKITISQARSAYRDGIIDVDALRALLKELGLSQSDINFYVSLDDYDLADKARKDEIDTIKAEVSLGALTVEEAIEQLYQLGLSDNEVVRIAVSLKQTKRAAAKTPDLGLLTRMAKQSLITEADFLDGVRALGYNDPWDTYIVALTFGPGASDGGSDAS